MRCVECGHTLVEHTENGCIHIDTSGIRRCLCSEARTISAWQRELSYRSQQLERMFPLEVSLTEYVQPVSESWLTSLMENLAEKPSNTISGTWTTSSPTRSGPWIDSRL